MRTTNEYYKSIQGWSDESIYSLYSDMIDLHDNATFVEIGSWKGMSASFLGSSILEAKKNIKVYAIDIWAGDEGRQEELKKEAGGGDFIFKEFLTHIKNCGLQQIVTPYRLPSVLAADIFDDNSLDFVFIDACHVVEEVDKDIKAWLPKVKKNGYIGGHDYPYIQSAVKKYFPEENIKGYISDGNTVASWLVHKLG